MFVRFPVMCSDKTALRSESQLRESRISDHDALQPLELRNAQGPGAGFADCFPPPYRSLSRGLLSFDPERSLAVVQQEKRGCPGENPRLRSSDNSSRTVIEPFRNLSFGRRCPANERAERWSTGQIIEHFMTAGRNARGETELLVRIEDWHGANLPRRRNIELSPRQPLSQKPKATRVRTRRFRPHESAKFFIGNDSRKRSEYAQVYAFPLQREFEVPRQSVFWCVPRCE